MTTRYELRPTANVNGNYLDVFIQGAPTSAGCEARVPLRTGREQHCREFAEHIINLLNADVLEQARRANMVEVLNRYAERHGLVGAPPSGRREEPDPAGLAPGVAERAQLPPMDADSTEERWQQC